MVTDFVTVRQIFVLYPRFGRLLLLFTVFTDRLGKVHASLLIIKFI